ncbi:MurR/RpiR family transcriptional regulator [Pseudomonas sp.]|uniref:MurR/RpiR family transcriptional regulator n=1 Tax=Pseudomonas sp. TaxID=306 RepID=UPI003CC60554
MMDSTFTDFSHKVYKTPLMQQMIQVADGLRHNGGTQGEKQTALYKVAYFILQNPWLSPTLNIERLAEGACTSTAAVNRLANHMGFNGFTGLREALVQHLLALVSPADQIHSELAHHPERGFGLSQQVRLSNGNLEALLNANDDEHFDAIVKAVSQASHLYILGFGNCHFLAGLAASCLVPHCAHVVTLNMEGGSENAAYRLATISQGDTLLTLALPPYTRDTLRMAQYARRRGAAVMAITDSPASPMVDIADHCLFAPPAHPVLRNSKVALLAIIEALASAVRLRNLEPVNESIRLAEDALQYLQRTGSDPHD